MAQEIRSDLLPGQLPFHALAAFATKLPKSVRVSQQTGDDRWPGTQVILDHNTRMFRRQAADGFARPKYGETGG
ncbi:hypothetical protein [Protofrankia symbiont of Coriaria ruscifolia]|uniref:hypothetical protein n=1 Tax=Protofrankia symbiont of Coriaria ruscifolia TaxID=1306542 RepID=UPI001F5E764C|nr:hypothetical protein [Protofrankia symbiont of Coriaria ruscifolia]